MLWHLCGGSTLSAGVSAWQEKDDRHRVNPTLQRVSDWNRHNRVTRSESVGDFFSLAEQKPKSWNQMLSWFHYCPKVMFTYSLSRPPGTKKEKKAFVWNVCTPLHSAMWRLSAKWRAAIAGKSIEVWSVKPGMSTSTLAPFALHYVHHWALRKKVTISRLHYRRHGERPKST